MLIRCSYFVEHMWRPHFSRKSQGSNGLDESQSKRYRSERGNRDGRPVHCQCVTRRDVSCSQETDKTLIGTAGSGIGQERGGYGKFCAFCDNVGAMRFSRTDQGCPHGETFYTKP